MFQHPFFFQTQTGCTYYISSWTGVWSSQAEWTSDTRSNREFAACIDPWKAGFQERLLFPFTNVDSQPIQPSHGSLTEIASQSLAKTSSGFAAMDSDSRNRLDREVKAEDDSADVRMADDKHTYRSWKKKYRKMRIVFDQKMHEGEDLHKLEQKALATARRLAIQKE